MHGLQGRAHKDEVDKLGYKLKHFTFMSSGAHRKIHTSKRKPHSHLPHNGLERSGRNLLTIEKQTRPSCTRETWEPTPLL